MKKALLASTALVGAALLLSAPVQAGTVGSGDNLEVKLSGFMWFQANWLDADLSDGRGRGYDFDINETELHINASNTADNGIKYGVAIEMEVNTDAGNNADEVWAFLDGDFGRIEMGDQDDATNRMLVGAYQAHKGISGPFGGLGGLGPVFAGTGVGPTFLIRTDWQVATSSDATKIIYFSPRFSGFQLGASFTPDSGGNGASFGEVDNDGDYENMIGLGLNYTNKFNDVGVSGSILYETATIEGTPNGGPIAAGGTGLNGFDDLQVLYFGAKVDFAGFTVGGNYTDFGDSLKHPNLPGFEVGSYWALGVGYQQGPWGVSGWYSRGLGDVFVGVENTITRWGIGGQYAVAPGWQVRADYNNNLNELTGFTDIESQAFILTNMFSF